jgi:hypothetical protein
MPDVGKAVTRHELYDAVYRKVGLSRTESSELVLDVNFQEVVHSDLAGNADFTKPQ